MRFVEISPMNYPAASRRGINRDKLLIAASSGVPACGWQVKLIYPDIPNFGGRSNLIFKLPANFEIDFCSTKNCIRTLRHTVKFRFHYEIASPLRRLAMTHVFIHQTYYKTTFYSKDIIGSRAKNLC